MSGLKRFMLLWVSFMAQHAFAAIPIVPENVLNQGEVSQITTQNNYFFAQTADDVSPIWRLTERKYGSHFLNSRHVFFSLDDVIQHVLRDGFPVQYMMQQLFRARLGVHVAVGGVIPRINILFGEGIAGVNMNQFFSGLFGFLVPSNWMKIVNQRREFQVSKYLLLKTYLDEILNAKLMYLRQHQNITEFEILNFYFIHLQLFSRTYSTNNRALATLHGRFAFEGTNMATQRGKTKLGFDDLAQVMALQQIEGDASVKHFNIQDLKDFPAQVKDLEDLEDLYKNQDAFISEVVRNSVELKAAHELLKIAQLNVGITAVGSIFSNVDRPQNANNDAQFALRFGYDTLPNILISRSLGKTAKIDVRKEYLDMLDSARRSFDLYTNSLGGYTEAKRALRVNRDAVRQNLDYLLRSKQDPDPSLILALSQLIESELKLNNALHGSLMARAYMDRFLLADYATVMKYLPDRQLLQDTLKVFADSHLEEVHKDAELDHFLYNVRHVEELKKLFQQPDHPYHEDELVSDHLIEAVKRNMDPLLYSKLSFFKNRAFYAFLDQFVQKNGIELTAHQQHLLDKKRKSLWSRWVHRRPSPHSKPEDLKL